MMSAVMRRLLSRGGSNGPSQRKWYVVVVTAAALSGLTPASPRAELQQAESARPTFDVASVKQSDPNARGQFQFLPGGMAVIRGVNLRLLIQQSYDVRDFQILGG